MRSGVKWIAVLTVIIVTLAAFAVSAGAEVRYQLVDLSASGMPYACAINNSGQIVGADSSGACLWNNGIVQHLPGVSGIPSYSAYSINDNGVAVGYCANPTNYTNLTAVYWQGGVATELTVGSSHARSINDAGQIVGVAGLTVYRHAFLYDNGNVTMLDDQPGYGSGEAYHINNSGQIAGWIGSSPGDQNACIWNGLTPQLLGFRGCAYDINDSGDAVGWAYKPFLWQNNTRVDIGSLGKRCGEAFAINNNGLIVGHCYNDTMYDGKAFIYENGVMSDLNTQIASGSGWNLISAYDINDHGQIVGYGVHNGNYQAFLLNPVPEPGSMVALISGLVGLVLVRRRR